MPDLGQKLTDERVEEIKERLLRVYSEASSDLLSKVKEYTEKYEKRDAHMKKTLSEDEYQRWRQGQVFIGKQWQSKVDQMARSLVDVERQAVEIVNGGTVSCFADNANYIEYRIDKDNGFGVNFGLYDETTVTELIKKEPELLRRRYVDGVACEAWNRKTISNCVTQGILQGEAINQIARRIARDTASTDMKAMVRYARTAMTCAQNAGRLQAMRESNNRGIECLKLWIATGDDRTRDAHAELDGHTSPVEKPFESILGPIMFPGDPNASDENVWNCRCALGYDYKNANDEEEISEYDEEEDEEEDFEEWKERKQAENEHIIVQGKDISATWDRREDDFDFEIEDVMNAQGFDGLPKVVSKEEFDKAVAESNFIAQRTYSAPDKETLDEYRNQLYNGKWYVDCSTGGAQYGQGMYCAADYSGKLSSGIKAEMDHYIALGKGRGNAYSNVETITLTPDAKIISYSQLSRLEDTKAEEIKQTIIEKGLPKLTGLTEKEEAYAAFRLLEIDSYKGHSYDEIRTWIKGLSGKEKDDTMEHLRNSGYRELRNYAEDSADYFRVLDRGAKAVLMGYDAINAENHGESGSYTVILNRTKCIILEGEYGD